MSYLTMQQAANLLQISYRKLWDMVNCSNNHPPFIMVGQQKRFMLEDIERWAKEQRVTSPASDRPHD